MLEDNELLELMNSIKDIESFCSIFADLSENDQIKLFDVLGVDFISEFITNANDLILLLEFIKDGSNRSKLINYITNKNDIIVNDI